MPPPQIIPKIFLNIYDSSFCIRVMKYRSWAPSAAKPKHIRTTKLKRARSEQCRSGYVAMLWCTAHFPPIHTSQKVMQPSNPKTPNQQWASEIPNPKEQKPALSPLFYPATRTYKLLLDKLPDLVRDFSCAQNVVAPTGQKEQPDFTFTPQAFKLIPSTVHS